MLDLNYDSLSAHYRAEVIAKLPASSLLSPSLLQSYPAGSDISLVPEVCGLLTARQILITRMDVVDLVEGMGKGELTAVEVMNSFGQRAAIAHQLTPCLTDFFLEDALKRAEELDSYFASTGKLIGPLHGVPISLKDQIQVKGKMTSLSFLSLHHEQPAAAVNAQLVDVLSAAGAVFFCHTMLPQSIMHLECESFWGRTLNPFNTNLTSGGSSGGEGALIAMRGSPLGVGSDIGGSIRSPASLCGLYGLRLTAMRIPVAGCRSYVPGRDSVLGSFGPLAQSLRDVELFARVVIESKPWKTDPSLLELEWRLGRTGGWEDGSRKLRVGIMRSDGEVRPLPPIVRAMEAVEQRLAGSDRIEIVEFVPFHFRKGWEIVRKLYFVDGGERINDLLNKRVVTEPIHPLSKWLLESAGERPVVDLTVHQLWELNIEREQFRYEFSQYWNSQQVDVVLSPIAPNVAPKHGESKWWLYTSHWNLVDYPAIAFPVKTSVDASLDTITKSSDWIPLCVEEEEMYKNYLVSDYNNAPVGLQLISKRNHDEELLDAMKLIQGIV